MTDFAKMAREFCEATHGVPIGDAIKRLTVCLEFAAAEERERCAKLCEDKAAALAKQRQEMGPGADGAPFIAEIIQLNEMAERIRKDK